MSVTVLMYHHVLNEPDQVITRSVEQFGAQMKFLRDNGYKCLTSSEFLAYKKGELILPEKSVFITFDDGWRDNFFHAYPILKEFNLNATIFIVTSWIEKASEQNARKKTEFTPLKHNEAKKIAPTNPAGVFLNWDEIEKMSDICNFHSHTNGHGDAYFDSLDLADDIFACRKIIKHRLGFDDKHLCWPRGRYSMESIKIAKNLGYEIFYTVERGVEFADKKLDEVTRIGTKGGAFWLARTLFLYQNGFTRTIYEKLHGKR